MKLNIFIIIFALLLSSEYFFGLFFNQGQISSVDLFIEQQCSLWFIKVEIHFTFMLTYFFYKFFNNLVISCADICQEDGLLENTEDRTSYFECTDGKSHFRRCPQAEDGLSYLVFNGKECVHFYPAFVCPQKGGNYRYIYNERQYYQCVENKPFLKDCPENHKFDGLECVENQNQTIINKTVELVD